MGLPIVGIKRLDLTSRSIFNLVEFSSTTSTTMTAGAETIVGSLAISTQGGVVLLLAKTVYNTQDVVNNNIETRLRVGSLGGTIIDRSWGRIPQAPKSYVNQRSHVPASGPTLYLVTGFVTGTASATLIDVEAQALEVLR